MSRRRRRTNPVLTRPVLSPNPNNQETKIQSLQGRKSPISILSPSLPKKFQVSQPFLTRGLKCPTPGNLGRMIPFSWTLPLSQRLRISNLNHSLYRRSQRYLGSDNQALESRRPKSQAPLSRSRVIRRLNLSLNRRSPSYPQRTPRFRLLSPSLNLRCLRFLNLDSQTLDNPDQSFLSQSTLFQKTRSRNLNLNQSFLSRLILFRRTHSRSLNLNQLSLSLLSLFRKTRSRSRSRSPNLNHSHNPNLQIKVVTQAGITEAEGIREATKGSNLLRRATLEDLVRIG